MKEYIEKIIERYVGKGTKKGFQISMKCPFHKGGKELRPSFSINTEKGLFHCFTCHESGTIPRLLKLLGVPQFKIDAEMSPIAEALQFNKRTRELERKITHHVSDRFRASPILRESILTPYKLCPTGLLEKGFNEDWLLFMEVGFDVKNNRITYPIRDMYGNLAGISGGASFAGQCPKYKIYGGGYTDNEGKWVEGDFGLGFDEDYPSYKFHNHGFLWNYEKVYPKLFWGDGDLILVEGFKSCLWLVQSGFWNTAALMGSSASPLQLEQILRLNSTVILMLDNDDAGRKGTRSIIKKLSGGIRHIKIVQYPDDTENCQPDDFDADELQSIISNSVHNTQYLTGVVNGN